jgi:transcriptional regulator with XRE-family HTH domain
MDLGSRIKKSRQKVGISQSELARRLEIAPSAVSHWEANRKTPEVKTLQKLADILDTTISYLTGEPPTEQESENKIELDELMKKDLYYKGKKLSAIHKKALLGIYMDMLEEEKD